MPYSYKFINKLDQLGMVHYTLVLKDTDNKLPDYYTPVLLRTHENTDKKLKEIAETIIDRETSNHNK